MKPTREEKIIFGMAAAIGLTALIWAAVADAEPFRPSRLSTASVEIVIDGEPYLCTPQPLEPSASGSARFSAPIDIGPAFAEAAPGTDCGRSLIASFPPACVWPSGDDAGRAAPCADPLAVRLLPERLRPGVIFSASADVVAANRVPGITSGRFFDAALAVVGDTVYDAYSVGLRSLAARPSGALQALATRDGFTGGWAPLSYPTAAEAGEARPYLTAIAALRTGVVDLVAVGGSDVGLSLWRGPALAPLYQRTGTATRVSVVEAGSRLLALGAAEDGVSVYDGARALAGPPCVDRHGEDGCGVRLGLLAGQTAHLAAVAHGGRVLVATAGAILELDPAAPTRVARSTPLPSPISASVWIETGGSLYIATVEGVDRHETLRIRRATGCPGGPCVLTSVASLALPGDYPSDDTLEVSVAGGRPWLWRGSRVGQSFGSDQGMLFDLGRLGRAGLAEMRVDGGRYADRCAGSPVGWAGYRQARNAFGVNNYSPRSVAIAENGVAVHASAATLETWIADLAPTPSDEIFADGFEGGNTGAWRK